MSNPIREEFASPVRLRTEIGDTIETVKTMEFGSYAGSRLAVVLANNECCRIADALIRRGKWRIREHRQTQKELTWER